VSGDFQENQVFIHGSGYKNKTQGKVKKSGRHVLIVPIEAPIPNPSPKNS